MEQGRVWEHSYKETETRAENGRITIENHNKREK